MKHPTHSLTHQCLSNTKQGPCLPGQTQEWWGPQWLKCWLITAKSERFNSAQGTICKPIPAVLVCDGWNIDKIGAKKTTHSCEPHHKLVRNQQVICRFILPSSASGMFVQIWEWELGVVTSSLLATNMVVFVFTTLPSTTCLPDYTDKKCQRATWQHLCCFVNWRFSRSLGRQYDPWPSAISLNISKVAHY